MANLLMVLTLNHDLDENDPIEAKVTPSANAAAGPIC